MCSFLLVVNMNRPCISHGCWDIELQRYQGHNLDPLESRDVISHVTIGLLMCSSFLHVVLWDHWSISHRCWDIICETPSQAYSRWKCIDPYFSVLGGKLGGYSILQLCACSRSLGTSFELLSATIGPQPRYCSIWTFPLKMYYGGEKLGQNRVRDHRFLTPNESVLTF